MLICFALVLVQLVNIQFRRSPGPGHLARQPPDRRPALRQPARGTISRLRRRPMLAQSRQGDDSSPAYQYMRIYSTGNVNGAGNIYARASPAMTSLFYGTSGIEYQYSQLPRGASRRTAAGASGQVSSTEPHADSRRRDPDRRPGAPGGRLAGAQDAATRPEQGRCRSRRPRPSDRSGRWPWPPTRPSTPTSSPTPTSHRGAQYGLRQLCARGLRTSPRSTPIAIRGEALRPRVHLQGARRAQPCTTSSRVTEYFNFRKWRRRSSSPPVFPAAMTGGSPCGRTMITMLPASCDPGTLRSALPWPAVKLCPGGRTLRAPCAGAKNPGGPEDRLAPRGRLRHQSARGPGRGDQVDLAQTALGQLDDQVHAPPRTRSMAAGRGGGGGRSAAPHLIARGHRRPGQCGGRATSPPRCCLRPASGGGLHSVHDLDAGRGCPRHRRRGRFPRRGTWRSRPSTAQVPAPTGPEQTDDWMIRLLPRASAARPPWPSPSSCLIRQLRTSPARWPSPDPSCGTVLSGRISTRRGTP